MPLTRTFKEGADLYDAIYGFKNYARESECLRAIINDVVPGPCTLLDVACDAGEHAKFLKQNYVVDGVDLNEDYRRALRIPSAITPAPI
jgi:hypothetical protein